MPNRCFWMRLSFTPPPVPTVAFFNNPFDREMMSVVFRRIEDVHRLGQSPVYIVYAHPYEQNLLSSSAFWVKLGSGRLWSVFGRSSSSLPSGNSE